MISCKRGKQFRNIVRHQQRLAEALGGLGSLHTDEYEDLSDEYEDLSDEYEDLSDEYQDLSDEEKVLLYVAQRLPEGFFKFVRFDRCRKRQPWKLSGG